MRTHHLVVQTINSDFVINQKLCKPLWSAKYIYIYFLNFGVKFQRCLFLSSGGNCTEFFYRREIIIYVQSNGEPIEKPFNSNVCIFNHKI